MKCVLTLFFDIRGCFEISVFVISRVGCVLNISDSLIKFNTLKITYITTESQYTDSLL